MVVHPTGFGWAQHDRFKVPDSFSANFLIISREYMITNIKVSAYNSDASIRFIKHNISIILDTNA